MFAAKIASIAMNPAASVCEVFSQYFGLGNHCREEPNFFSKVDISEPETYSLVDSYSFRDYFHW